MNDVAAVIIVVVGIVVFVIGAKTEPYEHVPVESVVKSTPVEAATGKTAMKFAATKSTACEAAVESSGREAAVKAAATAVKTTTTTAAVKAATTAAAVTTASATTAASRRDGRLSQAHGCQRQQRNNRFPYHNSLHLLEDAAPKCINVFAVRLFEDVTVN